MDQQFVCGVSFRSSEVTGDFANECGWGASVRLVKEVK